MSIETTKMKIVTFGSCLSRLTGNRISELWGEGALCSGN